jgi:DNA-directed RNA polymerase subunit RPC12/RpoP
MADKIDYARLIALVKQEKELEKENASHEFGDWEAEFTCFSCMRRGFSFIYGELPGRTTFSTHEYRCSECGFRINVDHRTTVQEYRFCPGCAHKMKVESYRKQERRAVENMLDILGCIAKCFEQEEANGSENV